MEGRWRRAVCARLQGRDGQHLVRRKGRREV